MAKTSTGTTMPSTSQHPGQSVPAPRVEPHAKPQLVPTRGSDAGAEILLASTTTTIGRGRDCDLVLDDPTISRHHADLHQHARHRYTHTDTGSLNGLYLNRHPTLHAHLADGDEIWIGTARFTFHLPTD